MKKYLAICMASALGGAAFTGFCQSLPWLISTDSQAQITQAQVAPGPLAGPNAYPPGGSYAGAPLRTREAATVLAAAPVTAPPVDDLGPEERINVMVYEKTNRSVVNINTRSVERDLFSLIETPSEGAGSGSVLDQAGHILTNHHVIDGAREVRVTLFNGNSYPAELVGQDLVNDTAVLRIKAPAAELFPVEIWDSSRLRVGQKVYAIGNPFGLERTMTTGIISSLNRQLPSKSGRTMKSIVQIDAALNCGNSGGPLFDSHGRLIGMNTAIASSTGSNTGVGFAIPVDTIKRIVPQLLASGRVVRPDMGITRVFQSDAGLAIASLATGGPAERAGLRGFRMVREKQQRGPFVYETNRIDRSTADVILGIDGVQVKSVDDLLSLIERKRPGEEVVVRILREGREADVAVKLVAGE